MTKVRRQQWGPFTGLAVILLIGVMLAVIGFIVFVEGGQRRIPVQYAKRVVGRRVMGGQMTYLPLRVNAGGVIPPIFASSLLTFPGTIDLVFGKRFPTFDRMAKALAWGEPLYTFIYVVLIIAFAFFYVGIVFNPDRAGRQHAQVRRIHPRHPARAQHLRAHQSHFAPADVCRRRLPGGGLPAAGMDDRRHSPAASCRAPWAPGLITICGGSCSKA